jgi:S1-C subfamily serine protease
MIEPLLMASVRISTFNGSVARTNASGFFFRRDQRLHLVTSRHVVFEPTVGHQPDRIEIEIHTDADDLGRSIGFSIPLYRDGQALWRDAIDGGGVVDVAVIDIDVAALPESAAYEAFTPELLLKPDQHVEIGTALLAVGYPLSFQDLLHHLPVARHATLASSFGLRFQGKGYFLIDARTHRGISGAPVVMRVPDTDASEALPWRLLGIHSSRLESGTRDPQLDETLGLNAVWYADVLMALTGTSAQT